MHSTFKPSWSSVVRRATSQTSILVALGLSVGVVAFEMASGRSLVASVVRSLYTPVLDASSVKSIDESRRRMEAGMTPAEAEQFKSDIACVAISSGIGPGLQGIEGDALIVESFKSIDGLDAPEIHRRAEAVRANVGGFFRNLAE